MVERLTPRPVENTCADAASDGVRDRHEDCLMASNTKILKFRRALRKKKAGRKAKSQRDLHGTTPKFAIHTPEADKNAPNQAIPSKDAS